MFGIFSKKKPAKSAPGKKAKTEAAKSAPRAAAPAKVAPAGAAPPKAEAPVSAGDSLERAKAKLAGRTAGPAGRKQLIEQALAVHQTQAKMLEQLPEETRNKLRTMALKAFVLGGPKDKSKLN